MPLNKKRKKSHLWKRETNDWYIEETWCAERLFDEEPFEGGHIVDPACGIGTIPMAAMNHGLTADAYDLVQREPPEPIPFHIHQRDWMQQTTRRYPNIVSNPPFKLCDDRKTRRYPFIELCLDRADHKVALLLPSKRVQGIHRSRFLEQTPLYRVWFLAPRPSMPPGPVLMAGEKPGSGTVDYAWFVWKKGYTGEPAVKWLRKQKGPSNGLDQDL